METRTLFIRLSIVFHLALISGLLFPQGKPPDGGSRLEEGMEGKNVPWITTPPELIERMLELAGITPRDFLIDLGSGDGRIVIAAAKKGTRALGVEYNPDLVELSLKNAENEGVSNTTQFVVGDIFEYDFSRASVITMFLLPEVNMSLRPKLFSMKPGTRIVSSTFAMQEWLFDAQVTTGDESNRWNACYLWIVPAKVQGRWGLPGGGELSLVQEYQMLSGSMKVGGMNFAVSEGRLRGNEIAFTAGSDRYTGLVSGDTMEGTVTSGGKSRSWSATR